MTHEFQIFIIAIGTGMKNNYCEMIKRGMKIRKQKGHSGFFRNGLQFSGGVRYQLQPLVAPQVTHLRQVPLRTMVRLPHDSQMSPV